MKNKYAIKYQFNRQKYVGVFEGTTAHEAQQALQNSLVILGTKLIWAKLPKLSKNEKNKK